MLKLLFTIFFLVSIKLNCYSAIGLGTKFSTIVLEKLNLGEVYNITQLRNLPLIVINSGDSEVDAMVEIEIPRKDELKEGYEPIPDPSWVRIVPNKFRLKPNEEMRCDVIITIPVDTSLIGKHYQLKIWSHTAGEDAFGAGVVNRMFFSIGTSGPEALQKAKRQRALFAVEMDVSPEKLYLTAVAGKKINIQKEFQKTISIINKSQTNIVVKAESVENKINAIIPEGFEFAPSPNLLKISPDTIKVKKRRMADLKMFIEIPNEEKYHNKKFMFLVKTVPIEPELPMEFYSRIFVTVLK